MFNIDIGSPQRQEQRKDENKDNDKDKDKKNKKTKTILDDGCNSPVTSDHIPTVANSCQTEVFSCRSANKLFQQG